MKDFILIANVVDGSGTLTLLFEVIEKQCEISHIILRWNVNVVFHFKINHKINH